MGDYIEVGKTSQFKDGDMKKVVAGGHEILLARVGDSYHAADNRCTHLGGELSAGKLEGNVVTCPRHGSQFDLSNGQVVRWMKGSGLLSSVGKALKPPRPLQIYPVKIEGESISVEI